MRGISPSSASGDYSDVTVTSPSCAIPWPKVSRLNDDEMRRLIIDVVDRTYRFIHTLFDENAGGELLLRLAQHDPVPQWNEPELRNPRCADLFHAPWTQVAAHPNHDVVEDHVLPPGCRRSDGVRRRAAAEILGDLGQHR